MAQSHMPMRLSINCCTARLVSVELANASKRAMFGAVGARCIAAVPRKIDKDVLKQICR